MSSLYSVVCIAYACGIYTSSFGESSQEIVVMMLFVSLVFLY